MVVFACKQFEYLGDREPCWLAVTDPKVVSWASAISELGAQGLIESRDWPCVRAVMKLVQPRELQASVCVKL